MTLDVCRKINGLVSGHSLARIEIIILVGESLFVETCLVELRIWLWLWLWLLGDVLLFHDFSLPGRVVESSLIISPPCDNAGTDNSALSKQDY